MAAMNAKILGTVVFVLIPSLALAQTGGETLASVDKSGAQVSQRGLWLGSGGNGSDGNGSITPSGGEFDAPGVAILRCGIVLRMCSPANAEKDQSNCPNHDVAHGAFSRITTPPISYC